MRTPVSRSDSAPPGFAILAAALALALFGCGGPPPPPNLLLVTVDTLRADRLACYGGAPDVGRFLCSLADGGAEDLARHGQPITLLSTRTNFALETLVKGFGARLKTAKQSATLPGQTAVAADDVASCHLDGVGSLPGGWCGQIGSLRIYLPPALGTT